MSDSIRGPVSGHTRIRSSYSVALLRNDHQSFFQHCQVMKKFGTQVLKSACVIIIDSKDTFVFVSAIFLTAENFKYLCKWHLEVCETISPVSGIPSCCHYSQCKSSKPPDALPKSVLPIITHYHNREVDGSS
jgi:hypothetical protein